MPTDGIIKFSCELIPAELVNDSVIFEINRARSSLMKKNFIGVNDKGIGFGNISVRLDNSQFIITASQTGHLQSLELQHLVVVKRCIFENNSVMAAGAKNPSSESLTHAAVYFSGENIGAVIHIHDKKLWNLLLSPEFIKTPPEAAYGSVKLADAIREIFKDSKIYNQKIFAIAGHEDGVVSFGKNLASAEAAIYRYQE